MIRSNDTTLNIFSLQNEGVKTLVSGRSNHNHIMVWNYDNIENIINCSKINSYFPSCLDNWESNSGMVSKPVWFGQLAQKNEGICHLTASQWRLRILCDFESYSKPSLWHWLPLSFFALKKSQGHCCPPFFDVMCWQCHSFSGKDMSLIIFPAICIDSESKDRPKEMKELTSSHMTMMNSRTQGLSCAFPHRIPPEPWGQASKNGPGLSRRDTLVVHFFHWMCSPKLISFFSWIHKYFPGFPAARWGHVTQY